MRLLLSHGAQPNTRDGSGATALHDAARRGPIQAVKLLLQFGADSEMRNDSNQSAERCAIQQKQVREIRGVRSDELEMPSLPWFLIDSPCFAHHSTRR